MASHPLKRGDAPRRQSNQRSTQMTPYDSLSHSDADDPNITNDSEYDEYSDELSGGYNDHGNDSGYDEYDDLNSEAQEYYNSGASELVTTVR